VTEDELADARRRRANVVDSKARKRRQLAALRGQPTGLIPNGPIRTRAKRLLDLGWSMEAIVHAADIDATSAGLRLIVGGVSRNCERKWAPVANLPITLAVPDGVPDTCWVPSLGAARRVQALMAIGWRHDDMTEYMGRSSHHLSAHSYKQINAHDWRLVDAAYEILSGAHGSSPKSRTRARAAGYLPPLAWTNIDNPREIPRAAADAGLPDPVIVDGIVGGNWAMAPLATKAERVEVVAAWIADGRNLSELADHTGWRPDRYGKSGLSTRPDHRGEDGAA